MSVRKQTPSEFLKQIIGKPVVVKLNSGVDYRGKLPNESHLRTYSHTLECAIIENGHMYTQAFWPASTDT